MNNIKYLLTLVLCFCFMTVMAQRRISGHVWNKADGPVIMANVVELDKDNRIVSATQTDASGNFSMSIKNPANRLRVTYIGYAPRELPIGGTSVFRIEMESKAIKEVVIKGTRRVNSNGFSIPAREISVAQQSLNMDEMEGLSFETAGEALQGQIAGLDIVANSGNLGAGTSMRLRGVSSINGNQEPLIVVDGYILEDYNADELDLNDMENEEQFATLLQVNPEDIQSIGVLKDAAATAIWGSRGANGVIEIKTRRGRRGKTRVNFSYRFSGSWQPEGMKMLDGDGYTMMLKEAYFNPNQSDVASGIVELMYRPDYTAYYGNFNNNTDWIDEVTQFGQTHNYGISIDGGGEKATFRVSASYDHETGTIIEQQLDRFTSRLALDYYVSDRIKFSSNFALTYTKNNKNFEEGRTSILSRAYQAMPNMTVYRQEYDARTGTYNLTDDYFQMFPAASAAGLVSPTSGLTSYYLRDMVSNGNPVAWARLAWRHQSTYTITPQFSIEYKLLGKGEEETQLNYQGEVYMNSYTETSNTYKPGALTSGTWEDQINTTTNYEYKSLDFRTKHTLFYIPWFDNTDHSLQMMARFEMGTSTNTGQTIGSSGVVGGITDPNVNAYLNSLSTTTGKGHTMSVTGSFHYAYKSKYIFDFTIRGDGSTKFGAGNKWGFFPGVSGRWNISDEAFFRPLRKAISMLAVRGGWGVGGNASFSEGLMYNNYGSIGSYLSSNAIAPSNLRLTEIRWEKTKSWNLGFNLGILDDLLSFDLNIYDRRTTDLLMENVGIPSSTGFSKLQWANVGSLKNNGWELYVNTRRLFNVGKFSMVVRFNLAQNINRITSMEPTVLASMNPEFDHAGANENWVSRVQIGNALGGIYGFRYKGVYRYDYDHSGYFRDQDDNDMYGTMEEWLKDPTQAPPTAAIAEAVGLVATTPVARDAQGNIIYDQNGDPKHMVYNYGGVGYEFQGGDVIYEDINHDGQIDELDVVYLGSSNPKINGGFGFDFNYGKWTLKTNFNFRVGNKIVNLARMRAEDMRTNKNQSTAVNWRWRKNGDITEIPRAMNNEASGSRVYNSLPSDRFVEKGDFVRLQYLQLSYSFDADKLKRFGIRSLRLAASGNNLWFWTRYHGVDPEHSQSGYAPCIDDSQTPRSRSFTLSLNIGF